ncbi:MAG: hypothetical protein Q8K78_02665, partial [Planctomycetaceae bacterium]|nr:hypothetical protein [Planctomycetaceae bacterium]
MIHAYDEIIDFIAAGAMSEAVARFEASPSTRDYVADLLHKEKATGLTAEEASELEHFLSLEQYYAAGQSLRYEELVSAV